MSDHNDQTQSGALPSVPLQPVVLPLGPKHKGMRMCATGLLKNAAAWLPRDRTGERWTLEQLSEHLTELGSRFYAGDVLVVDEFLQLYALDADRQNTAVRGDRKAGVPCTGVVPPDSDNRSERK